MGITIEAGYDPYQVNLTDGELAVLRHAVSEAAAAAPEAAPAAWARLERTLRPIKVPITFLVLAADLGDTAPTGTPADNIARLARLVARIGAATTDQSQP